MITQREVNVYWDSRQKLFSIRDHVIGVVIAKAGEVFMHDVRFVASEAARQRCLARGQREAHAWVRGFLCEPRQWTRGMSMLTVQYLPHLASGFRHGEQIVLSGEYVECRIAGPADQRFPVALGYNLQGPHGPVVPHGTKTAAA